MSRPEGRGSLNVPKQLLTGGRTDTLVTARRTAADAGAFEHTVYGPSDVLVTVSGESGAPETGRPLGLGPPRPNPAAGETRLEVSVAEAQPVDAVLVDALGREVAVLFRGPVEAGGRRTLVVAGVPPGTYVVRVRGAAGLASQRLTLLGVGR